ncbi:MAG: hypothetical protein WDN25_10375 [Acetobacteraceae bacterium]
MLNALPAGDLRAAVAPHGPCEGLALAEAFRGDVLVWLRIDAAGRIDRCHLRDASWFQWPAAGGGDRGQLSSRTSRCATSRSTVPIRGTTCDPPHPADHATPCQSERSQAIFGGVRNVPCQSERSEAISGGGRDPPLSCERSEAISMGVRSVMGIASSLRSSQ